MPPGSTWHDLQPMARTVTLRPWQKNALERFAASGAPDFLAVATPGAGKTTFALTAARQALAADPARRLIVVVPTAHLKAQWAAAATAFDLHLDPRWSAVDATLPRDMHGIVTTYQQVATSASVLRGIARNAFVIFDELHHAADDRAWGEAIRKSFEEAARRLALSGTPFRSDVQAIPFVLYAEDEAVADYEYGYADALTDGGVVRPVYFPRIDGMMEWSAPDGNIYSHSFEDTLDSTRASQRLRTAYSLDGEWLPHVLRQAHEQLLAIRKRQPGAGGLVIATDQDHARGIVQSMQRRLGVRAVVATSDDPEASAHISASPAAPIRGSWRCGWCRRASTSPACGSGCSRPRRLQSCSSGRPSGASFAGRRARRARSRSSSSPTTRGCGPGRSPSPSSGATACGVPILERLSRAGYRWVSLSPSSSPCLPRSQRRRWRAVRYRTGSWTKKGSPSRPMTRH